jgi:hypothetical protein
VKLIHRPFVWTYWLVASLTARCLFSIAAEQCLRFATAIVIVSIVALMLVLQRGMARGYSQGSGRERRRIPACAWIAA